MSKVLVTGATGFIGAHLAKRLADAGESVACLVRDQSRATDLQHLDVRLAEGNVEKPASLVDVVAQAEVVYHLAGATLMRSPVGYNRVNRQGTRNVAAACAAAPNPPVLIYVSSLAAVGAAQHDEGASETDSASPVSAYGRSKLAGEKCLAEFAGQVPITVVRPPMVFGPRERHLLSFFKLVRQGWVVVPGFRHNRYSFAHVEDLVEALLLAASRGRRLQPGECAGAPGVYHIAHRERPTLPELGRFIATALDRRSVRTLRLPLSVWWAAAGFLQLMSRRSGQLSVLTFDKVREASAGSWTCQTNRAEAELGFHPPKPLGCRFQETTRWYLENGWL